MIVTLLSDYGTEDEFVGVCHGVIRKISPGVEIVDVTHGIPRHEIRHGAIVLRNAIPYLPTGVHVAVVDPQGGTERRAVAVRCEDGQLLVGPDNGLLWPAAERCGGPVEAVDIVRSPHRLEPVSPTFHGRDIFAPVAARLAQGAELGDAGEEVDVDELVRLELPTARVEDGAVIAHVLLIDGFGNASLDITHAEVAGTGLTLGRRLEVVTRGESRAAIRVQTFADVAAGETLLYENPQGTLALAMNRGELAVEMGLAEDAEVRLEPR